MIEADQRIPLGTTDLRISRLGLGTWAWGDRFYWGYGRGGYSDSDLEEAFNASVAGGINFFDTAEVYGVGKSEKFLDSFINEHGPADVTHDSDLVVATKFFPYPWRILSRSLESALKASLKRLGKQHAALYQTHWPWPPRSVETWTQAMARCVEKGLVTALGVSNYKLDLMRRAQRVLSSHGLALTSNQVEYSLLNRTAETSGLLDACLTDGVTLLAYSPIGSGILSGKYSPENPPPGPRGRRYNSHYLDRIKPLFELMDEIGLAHGRVTHAQIALNWVISKGAVPIPGAKNAEQARDNLGALGWQLSPEEVAALDQCTDLVLDKTPK